MSEEVCCWTNKRVLVTGGAGFIGSAIVRRLEREGAIVTVLDESKNSPNRSYRSSVGRAEERTVILNVDRNPSC